MADDCSDDPLLVDLTQSQSKEEDDESDKKHGASATIDLSQDDSDSDSGEGKARSSITNSNRKRKRALAKTQQHASPFAAKKPPPASSSMTLFDCPICLESVERFRGYSLSRCAHTFCRQCLHGYIQAKLKDKAVRQLTCPHADCQKRHAKEKQPTENNNNIGLCPNDIRASTLELGDTASWRAYQELSTQTFLDTAANAADAPFRRCPTDRCNFTFQYYPNNNNNHEGQLFICPECDQAYCLNCPVVNGQVGPAHDDTCVAVLEQVQRSRERQAKLEAWKKENAAADARFQELLRHEAASGRTKPCPNCGTAITKNGGCSHMYCTSCSTHFTW